MPDPTASASTGGRRAAVAGVAGIVARSAEQAERAMRTYGPPPEAIDTLRRRCAEAASASPDALTGYRVTLEEFYGPAFDTATGTLARLPADRVGDFSATGFVAALLTPPYGIRPHTAGYRDEHDLLTDVITDVLQTPTTATPIWYWVGDWCSYFDAGREWWGAAAWTLRVRPDEILTIAASSTD